MPRRITSRENEQVKYACRLASSAQLRAEENMFFAEGPRLCKTLAQKLCAHLVFITESALLQWPEAEFLAKEAYIVSDTVAEKLAGTKTTQGVFCVFPRPKTDGGEITLGRGVLVCERLQDPANVGAD